MDQGGGKDDLFLEFGQVSIFKVVYYIVIFMIKFIPYTVLIFIKEIELFLLIPSPFPSRIAIKLFKQRCDLLFAAHLSIIQKWRAFIIVFGQISFGGIASMMMPFLVFSLIWL